MTRDLARLATGTFDLLVVGGGIYGLTIAADAAQRGLSVALVEREDFGSGTSFNHLRTIHGGLRYLQTLDLERARESILERRTLARIAPHALRPLPFVLPLTSRLVRGPLMMRAGLLVDAFVARDRNTRVADTLHLPSGRVLSAEEARSRYPAIDRPDLRGAAVWYDYVTVEADRLTLAWALLASAHGAQLANHAEAAALRIEGARVTGAQVRDRITGATVEVRARLVVNATGAGVDTLLPPDARTGTPLIRVMNLVTRLEAGDAALGGQAASGRALFMVPWRGRALFGTFESSAFCRADDADPAGEEIDRFLAEVASAFPRFGLTRADVTLVHRGVVPARAGRGGLPTLEGHQRVRDHANGPRAVEGLISIAGTKYTTARSVAEQIVDRVLVKIGRPATPSQTAGTPLTGTDQPIAAATPQAESLAPFPPDVRRHLEAAYGPAAPLIATLASEQPAFAARLAPDQPVIGAQIAWAVRHEMAVTLADAVIRRTPLGAVGHPGPAALAAAAELMAVERRWTVEERAREVERVDAFYALAGGPLAPRA
ncbi:MAG: FAD-dependent oxidoreductase [Vicinamibacterales bacterium]